MRRNGEFLGTIRNRLTTFLAVGSLALSSFVGSCSAERQTPDSTPAGSTASESATAGTLTYEELAKKMARVIQFGSRQLLTYRVQTVKTAARLLYAQLLKSTATRHVSSLANRGRWATNR